MKNLMSIIIPIFFLTTLTTAQDDITHPELTYFSFAPDTVNVTDSSAVVNVTGGAIDDMSGISYVQAYFRSPSGDQYEYAGIGFNGSMSDTLTTQFTIDQYSESGEWYVYSLAVGDQVGNEYYYYTSELDSMGFETILVVTSVQDTAHPELTYFSFAPDTVNVTDSSAVVNVTGGAIDDMSGISYVQAYFRSPSGDQYEYAGIGFNGSMSDTLTTQFTIDQYSESGEWYVYSLAVGDQVGNEYYYYTSELDSMGFETILVVTSVQDTAHPELTYFSFAPDTVNVTDSSAVVNVTGGAVDDMSGISYVQAYFRSPSGDQYEYAGIGFNGSMSDTLTTQFTIDQYSESGEWYVYSLAVGDQVGNEYYYYTSELDSMGMETILTVNYSSGYEGQVLHVATTGTDSTGDGSEENPFATIQHGIDAANDGDTVLVAAGTYVENINFNGKNIEVLGEARETTIIHGNQEEIVVWFGTGEDSTALISGFTITNGSQGIKCLNNSNPRIENNIITGNAYDGPNTYVSSASGAGISVHSSSPRIYNNVISNNAVFNNDNYGSTGGALHLYYSNLFSFDNNTIVNNHSDWRGGGIYIHGPSSVSGVNNIIWGNDAEYGSQIFQENVASSFFSYSDIEGGWEGEGNIDFNPHFCAAFFGDYHLAEGSPCIGSGLDGANIGALGVGCEFPQFPEPEIMSVTDVPEDQGGRVYVEFSSSMFDHPEGTNQSYTIFRMDALDDSSAWIVVASGAAIGDPSYTYEVPTLRDSTADDDGMTELRVVASMNEGNFHSGPAMGYSVDNIAPGVPTGLMATAVDVGIQLTWDHSQDDDFQYFTLEKSVNENFTDFETVNTIDTAFTDMEYELNQTYFYRIAAVDHAGNMSEYSDVVDIAVLAIDLDLIPDVYALHQNYPNPFNPTTTLRYDLPDDAMVTITVYNMMGRVVCDLVSRQQTAGYRSIQWNATNNTGQPVSAGVYLYTIEAGEFRQTRKMVLLK